MSFCELNGAQAIANGRNWSTSIVGESPEYLLIRDWQLAASSMFTERDVRSAAKVAVVGSKTSVCWLAKAQAWADKIKTID